MLTAWDVIVVGAGSAGAVIAARCSEGGARVLLLEAGPEGRAADLPTALHRGGHRMLLEFDAWEHMRWNDLEARRTAAQKSRLYLRGRGMGGSSAINGMMAIRPPREDYDDWAAAGFPEWSYEQSLPHLQALESDVDFGAEPYHGDNGPIPVWRMKRDDWGAVDEALARAAAACNFGWADDLNAPGATGVSPYPINTRNLRRVSTNDGYLEPARQNPNLTIRGNALVNRVIFKGSRAVGVEFLEGGCRHVEHGEKIVVAAGAIHSPAILMRSGVGQSSLLEGLGVDVVADLPVGDSLQDHPMLAFVLSLRPEAASVTPDDRSTNCCVRYSSSDPDGSPNDMFLLSFNFFDASGSVWPHKKLERDGVPADAGMIGLWLNQPYSRGFVRIRSDDPTAQPIIEERMLSDERDMRRLRDGVRTLAHIVEHDAVSDICAVAPRDSNPELWEALDNDAKLSSILAAAVVDTMHATSTCPIGRVVDGECRVLTVENLYVADASIFPSVPRANTNLATIAVGEAAAAFLR